MQLRTCRGLQHRQAALRSVASPLHIHGRGRQQVIVRAAADDDEELERRLAKLKKAKGDTPYGQSAKAPAKPLEEEAPKKRKEKAEKVVYDFSDETLHYEGPPHRGDLALNVVLGATLFWIPLTIAALGRGLFVQYRFTNKRISVTTTAPWKNEQLDAAYQEVKEVRSIPRGVGIWGDMVVELKDGSKIEMRALDNFRDLQAYILARRDELSPRSNDLTQEELLGEPAAKKGSKGFA